MDFAVALGATRDEVYNYKPSMHMLTALRYWDNASRTKPWLEAFAAIGGLEIQNSGKLAKLYNTTPFNSRATFQKLGLGEADLAHWEAGESADHGEDGHGDATFKIIAEYAATAESQQKVLAAFEESVAVFWHVYNHVGLMARNCDMKKIA